MNKELFQSMQKQMTPSPEVRAALSEKLAAKKRPVPWMKYGAVAACAALAVGAVSVYGLRQNPQAWMLITRNFHHDVQVQNLHSYVTVEGLTGYFTENAAETGSGTDTGGALSAPNTGDLPGGAYIGDAPSQEEAINAYQKLMDRFSGAYPDWYGGAYIDPSGWLVVQLVEDEDPGDKTPELQVLDWAGSDYVMFSSCKYSLSRLNGLMDQLNRLPDANPEYGQFMAGWGIDEEANRIELTLTQVNDHILSVLAELDPADDMILVQVGQRATVTDTPGEVVTTSSAKAEEPVSHNIIPGGAVVPDAPISEGDDDLIAVEPWVNDLDGAEELPEQKQPAAVRSVPEEDSSAFTAAYDPDRGFIYPNP